VRESNPQFPLNETSVRSYIPQSAEGDFPDFRLAKFQKLNDFYGA